MQSNEHPLGERAETPVRTPTRRTSTPAEAPSHKLPALPPLTMQDLVDFLDDDVTAKNQVAEVGYLSSVRSENAEDVRQKVRDEWAKTTCCTRLCLKRIASDDLVFARAFELHNQAKMVREVHGEMAHRYVVRTAMLYQKRSDKARLRAYVLPGFDWELCGAAWSVIIDCTRRQRLRIADDLRSSEVALFESSSGTPGAPTRQKRVLTRATMGIFFAKVRAGEVPGAADANGVVQADGVRDVNSGRVLSFRQLYQLYCNWTEGVEGVTPASYGSFYNMWKGGAANAEDDRTATIDCELCARYESELHRHHLEMDTLRRSSMTQITAGGPESAAGNDAAGDTSMLQSRSQRALDEVLRGSKRYQMLVQGIRSTREDLHRHTNQATSITRLYKSLTASARRAYVAAGGSAELLAYIPISFDFAAPLSLPHLGKLGRAADLSPDICVRVAGVLNEWAGEQSNYVFSEAAATADGNAVASLLYAHTESSLLPAIAHTPSVERTIVLFLEASQFEAALPALVVLMQVWTTYPGVARVEIYGAPQSHCSLAVQRTLGVSRASALQNSLVSLGDVEAQFTGEMRTIMAASLPAPASATARRAPSGMFRGWMELAATVVDAEALGSAMRNACGIAMSTRNRMDLFACMRFSTGNLGAAPQEHTTTPVWEAVVPAGDAKLFLNSKPLDHIWVERSLAELSPPGISAELRQSLWDAFGSSTAMTDAQRSELFGPAPASAPVGAGATVSHKKRRVL